jgi:hypothetical protein
LWSTVVGNCEVQSDLYVEARQFVIDDQSDFSVRRMKIDPRNLPGVESLKAKYGHIFNLIFIRNDNSGRVIAHFALYNIIGWQVVLAEISGIPNRYAGLVSNSLDPNMWSDNIVDSIDISFDWLNSPPNNDEFKNVQKRLTEIVGAGFETSRTPTFHEIIINTFESHGLMYGDVISPEAITEISARIACWVTNTSYKKTLTPNEIENLLKASFPMKA